MVSSQPFFDALPDILEDDIADVVTRLPERYFEFFSFDTQCDHIVRLSRLSTESPIEIILHNPSDDRVECTVITHNYPFLFSLITGLLSSNGVEIRSGEIFTYAKQTFVAPRQVDRRRILGALRRRKIVDFFSGRFTGNVSFRKWARELTDQFVMAAQLLELGTETSLKEAVQVVNRQAATHIKQLATPRRDLLSPARVEFDNSAPDFTRLILNTENTPFFLYAFSTALAHHEISIDHLSIMTVGNRVEDTFDLTDHNGQKLESPDLLDQLRLSVLLCKQFAFFLDGAPNPFDAISRFEQLVESILALPEKGQWLGLLSNPLALQDMARLLGASDYLWEDFIRLHYESLLPVLGPHHQAGVYDGEATIEQRLSVVLQGATDLKTKKEVLNHFKDNEIFLMDLDHILEQSDLLKLSKRLTLLVEAVVRHTISILLEELVNRYGNPMTIGAIPPQLAVFGLGKLGGAALGYASDIELLFVYSDNGMTDVRTPISNADFFAELVREVRQFIVAKRSGIFDIDLRLRPYGNDGPLAVSVENFCRYFGASGPAHIYEKLALVRLRYVAGDRQFGKRIEKLRDEFVYDTDNFDFSELWQLRKKQFEEKASANRLNAKFSPGALVDIEYAVQALQIMYGREDGDLRTPRIREALAALRKGGVLEVEETSQIIVAYIFFRRLINGLRMLRGSAEDLFLPLEQSSEYDHLARRMGYSAMDTLTAANQLHIEFETVTATVRRFVERYFYRQSLPSQTFGNVADLVLNPELPQELRLKILARAGFPDPVKANVNLRHLADAGESPAHFARLAVLACEWIRHKPDPDMALNNWERFVRQLANPAEHYDLLLSQPARLDILLDVFSVSQFLSDSLIRYPEFFSSVTQKGYLHRRFRRGTALPELSETSRSTPVNRDWRNRLRLFKRRELLRIAIKDISLQIAMPEIYRDISLLAESIIQVCLERAWGTHSDHGVDLSNRFCMLAMGKLGGTELNYSSDIDLIPVFNADGIPDSQLISVIETLESVLRQFNDDMGEFTEEGQCYRVDFSLRPFGKSGQWISTMQSLADYYAKSASKWEIQALLKMRPVGGNWAVGFETIGRLRHVALTRYAPEVLVDTIKELRKVAIRKSGQRLGRGIDIKSGEGGIRDIEFWVQGQQLLHLKHNPQLWLGRTLAAIESLKELGIITPARAVQLRDIYLFFRRIEHFLQLVDDQQTHVLPTGEDELMVLAKRLLGSHASADELVALVDRYRDEVVAVNQA
jgi:glutamate-ammonia-ligase adenylyltransferase